MRATLYAAANAMLMRSIAPVQFRIDEENYQRTSVGDIMLVGEHRGPLA